LTLQHCSQKNKNEMFTDINEYHTLHGKAGLKAAPDKTFFFLKKVRFLGHVISPEGIQPIAKRVKDLKNLKSPESKRDVMKVLGCLGFYCCYIKNLHVDSQPRVTTRSLFRDWSLKVSIWSLYYCQSLFLQIFVMCYCILLGS